MPQTVWPIRYNWANNFLLNVDGKSPISCPDQQGMSIIAFSVRGGFFSVGPGDWMWVRARSMRVRAGVCVSGGQASQCLHYMDVEFCKSWVKIGSREPGNHSSTQNSLGYQ